MSDMPYWTRFWQRRVTRRKMLQMAGLGAAGLAAAAVVGCDEGDEGSGTSASPSGTAGEQAQRGGTITAVSFGIDAPTLDVHKTSFGPHGTAGR